jgi:hypothetical protein
VTGAHGGQSVKMGPVEFRVGGASGAAVGYSRSQVARWAWLSSTFPPCTPQWALRSRPKGRATATGPASRPCWIDACTPLTSALAAYVPLRLESHAAAHAPPFHSLERRNFRRALLRIFFSLFSLIIHLSLPKDTLVIS